jgi:hypothetical protein
MEVGEGVRMQEFSNAGRRECKKAGCLVLG